MSELKLFRLAIILTAVVVFASCIGPASPENPGEPENRGENAVTSPVLTPSWLNGSHPLFPYSRYITGTGCATGNFGKELVDQARLNARVNISEVISSRIRSEIGNYARKIVMDGQFKFNQETWTRSSSESELVLYGSRFPDTVKHNPYYDEKDRTLFIFAVLDRRAAADYVVNRLGILLTYLDTVLERGEAALKEGMVPAALRAFSEVREKLPPDSGELFTAWFLVNDHPDIRRLAEKKQDLRSRVGAGVNAVTATLDISVEQETGYLSREKEIPARVIVKTTVTPPGGKPVPATGVPLVLEFSGGPKLASPSDRTHSDGSLTTIAYPTDRTVPLAFSVTVTPDHAKLINDGLPTDLTKRLCSRASVEKAIHFRPQLSRKILVGSVVTVIGTGVTKKQIETLRAEVERFLADCATGTGTDTDPLSSIDPSGTFAGFSAGLLSEKLRLQGRFLCRGLVEIETKNPGAASAVAIWKGLDLIDLREGKMLISGYLKGEKGRGQFGEDEYDAARRDLHQLFDELKDRIGREIDEHCREK